MKKILAALLLGSLAQAQTSTTTTSTAKVGTTSAAAAAGVNSASLETTAQSSKIGYKIISENTASVGSLKDNSEGAASTNSFGIGYKFTPAHAMEFRARVATEFNKSSADKTTKSHMTQMADPTIHYNYTSDWSLAGSEPVVFANRYYIPVSQDSVDKKSNGVVRNIVALNWNLNPRVSMGFGTQTFFIFNKDGAEKTGSDGLFNIAAGPIAAYNFSDKLNVYYNPYMDTTTSNYTRGSLSANVKNDFCHELGMNIKSGIFEVNPFVAVTTSSLGTTAYSNFGSDSGTSYNLNVSAIF